MEDELIEAPENEITNKIKIIDWLSGQIVNSPLRSVFIMLIIAISTLSSLTVYIYNQKENEREKQIHQIENQWVRIYEKSEKDVIEYKERWIDCLETEKVKPKNKKKK